MKQKLSQTILKENDGSILKMPARGKEQAFRLLWLSGFDRVGSKNLTGIPLYLQ